MIYQKKVIPNKVMEKPKNEGSPTKYIAHSSLQPLISLNSSTNIGGVIDANVIEKNDVEL